MKIERAIGWLLILGAVGVFVPYTVLTITFDYPDILRQEGGLVLTRFHQGGASLICTWLAFALLGIPLVVAYSLIGQRLESQIPYLRWVTTLGVVSGIVQIVGLLRWVFVVPVLASDYVKATEPAAQEAIVTVFKAVHQFGGVLLGEHVGQLLTVIWTVFISIALLKVNIIPRWIAWWGFVSSFIYFLAQAELLATVIPHMPRIEIAGFLGSTLWLLWLILTGSRFIRRARP